MEESSQIVQDEASLQHGTSNAIRQMRIFLYISLTSSFFTISALICVVVRLSFECCCREEHDSDDHY